ncbi:MAG: SDR family oxidoreductase [Flavobacteriales bacterium]|nr:SDR family oxidoreductase [Flavobacteriales bacterium]
MNIVITGASRGIGFETAKFLSNDSNNIVITISRDMEQLKKLANESAPGKVVPIAFDLSGSVDTFNELQRQIHEHIDRVDVLINNAGYLVNKPFEEIDELDMELVFKVNLFGIIKLSQILLPSMGGDVPSHIVNIGSMGGYQGSDKFAGLSLYSASKGAVATLSECMAEEFGERNIKVNCLALGAVQTEMLSKAFPGYVAPVQAVDMGRYIAEFAIKGIKKFNGEVIPIELG